MIREEDLFSTKNKILEITKGLNSHYNKGDFIDPDKNFNELLASIKALFEKEELLTDIITNEEMHIKYKQKYEEAVEYIKLLESERIDSKIGLIKADNDNLNKSLNSAIAFDNVSNNGDNFYISESPDFKVKYKLKRSSNLANLIRENKAKKEHSNNSLNSKATFIFGMESDKLRDEYIKVFEEKKALEHQNLLLQDKLSKLEPLEKQHQEALIQLEALTDKNSEISKEQVYLKERIKQLANENMDMISLNNNYIEAINAFHSETGNKNTKIILENFKIKNLEKELTSAKNTVNDFEKLIDEINEKYVAEQEERYFIEKQYEDFLYEKDNELANLRFENQKNLKENFIEQFFSMQQTPNNLDFFYNEETDKIEIFVNNEKIVDINNNKPAEEMKENSNESESENVSDLIGDDCKDDCLVKINNKNEESIKGNNSTFFGLIKRKYSADFIEKKSKRLLSEFSFLNLDIEVYDEDKNNNDSNIKNKQINISENKNDLINGDVNNNMNKLDDYRNALNESDDNYKNESFYYKSITPKKHKLIGSEFSCKNVSNFNLNNQCQFEIETPKKAEELIYTPKNNDENQKWFNYPYFLNRNEEANQSGSNENLLIINNSETANKNIYNINNEKRQKSFNSLNKIKSVSQFIKMHKHSKSISFAANNIKETRHGLLDVININNKNNDKNYINNNNRRNKKLSTYINSNPSFSRNLISRGKLPSKKITKRKSTYIRSSQSNLTKKSNKVFHSHVNSETLLSNFRKKFHNSEQVQNFVLQNLNIEEDNIDEFITDKSNNTIVKEANKDQISNINDNKLDVPLFKSANSSFLNETSFNAKVVRRTTIDNFNLLSNKLSAIAVDRYANFINDFNLKQEENVSEKSNEIGNRHDKMWDNASFDNNKQAENFVLKDLIEEDKNVIESLNKKYKQNKLINVFEMEKSIDYKNGSFCFDNNNNNIEEKENEKIEKNVLIDIIDDIEEPKSLEDIFEFTSEKDNAEKLFVYNNIHNQNEKINNKNNLDFNKYFYEKIINEPNELNKNNTEKDLIKDSTDKNNIKEAEVIIIKKKKHKRSFSNQNIKNKALNLFKTNKKLINKNKENKPNDKIEIKNDKGFDFSQFKSVINDKDNIILESEGYSLSSSRSYSDKKKKKENLLNKEKTVKSNKNFKKALISDNDNKQNIHSAKLINTIDSKLNKFDSDFQLCKTLKKEINKINEFSEKTQLKTNFKSPNNIKGCTDSQIKLYEKTQELKKSLIINKSKLNYSSSKTINTNSYKKFNTKAGFDTIKESNSKFNKPLFNNENEVEKCIKNIKLQSFNDKNFINTKQDNFSNIDYADFKKKFKNEEFKFSNNNSNKNYNKNYKASPKKGNFSTNNITTNNNNCKYIFNLLSNKEAACKNTNAENDYFNSGFECVKEEFNNSNNQKNVNKTKTKINQQNKNVFDKNKIDKSYEDSDPSLINIVLNNENEFNKNKVFYKTQKYSYSDKILNNQKIYGNNFKVNSENVSKEAFFDNNISEKDLVENFDDYKSKYLLNEKIKKIKENFGLNLHELRKPKLFNELVIVSNTNEFYVISNNIKYHKESKYSKRLSIENKNRSDFVNCNNSNYKENNKDKSISLIQSNVNSSDSDICLDNYNDKNDKNDKIIINKQKKNIIQPSKESKQSLAYDKINIDYEFLDREKEFPNFSAQEDKNILNLTCNEQIYTTENFSMPSIENRKNILLTFCKEKDINFVNNPKVDKTINFEKLDSKHSVENSKKERIKLLSKKLIDGKSNPLSQSKIVFKNMADESTNSRKRNKYKFESKSFINQPTVVKEEQQGACKRCSIF